MPIERLDYALARKRMQPGDVLAFGGKGEFSQVIKWATRSAVSHVGVVLQSKVLNDAQDRYLNLLIESASLNGFNGVTINRASERVAVYEGEVWWLPLNESVRAMLDTVKFYDFLLEQNHKPYDLPQAVKSAADLLDGSPVGAGLTLNREDMGRFFCSELVVAGLEAGGVLHSINSAEVTPIDLCMFNIYEPTYYQLKGDTREIRGFNSVAPIHWGVGDVAAEQAAG